MRKFLQKLNSHLVNSLKLDYDPANYPDAPKPDKISKVKNTNPSVLPDNVRYDPAFKNLVKRIFDTEAAIELEVYRPEGRFKTNEADLVDTEAVQLGEKGLDILKAKRLKPLWANGLSSEKAAKMLVKETGYSWATVKKYWAVFNANASTLFDDEKTIG